MGSLSAADLLADPTASFALKAVLRAWMGRDRVDAALDARMLWRVLDGEAERALGGRV